MNFDRVHNQEIYKWKAVKCFQDNWNLNTSNFPIMLEKSLALTSNLLDSGQYFPRRMLLANSKKDPSSIKNQFIELYNEDMDLIERIETFQKKFELYIVVCTIMIYCCAMH